MFILVFSSQIKYDNLLNNLYTKKKEQNSVYSYLNAIKLVEKKRIKNKIERKKITTTTIDKQRKKKKNRTEKKP